MNKLVSIVTPSFNQGKYLAETMRSVLEQDYAHLEYIVIDGASMDNSLDVIRSFADRLAYWQSEADQGKRMRSTVGLQRPRDRSLPGSILMTFILPGR